MAGRLGLALYSCSSAIVSSVSSSSSMPVPFVALVLTTSTSPPHSLGNSSLADRLVIDAVDVDARQIDLVERDDDRHFGGLGVADGFFGLRHDAVVGRHDQHGDVGHVRTASPHLGERFVARRIDERNSAAVLLDGVGANVLRDAAAFAADDVDADDAIQQRRLAVVDVAQEGDDRRTRHQRRRIIGLLLEFLDELDLRC